MHESSYELMRTLLEKVRARDGLKGSDLWVMDCGSALAGTGLQKTYRDFFVGGSMQYVGMDAHPGENVTLVADIYELEGRLEDQPDLIISGQMLEHLTFPLLAVQQMKSILATGRWMILIAPWQYGIHRYPIDCWRVLPNGMEFLFEGFRDVEVGVQKNDCWGIGWKPPGYKTPWTISRS